MPKHSLSDRSKRPERSHTRKQSTSTRKSKSKKMANSTEEKDYVRSATDTPSTGVGHQEQPKREDLALDAQYEMIDAANLREILKPNDVHSTNFLENNVHDSSGQTNDAAFNGVPPEGGGLSSLPQNTGSQSESYRGQGEATSAKVPQQGENKKTQLPELPAGDIEAVNLEIQLEQLRREYDAKMNTLKVDHDKRMSEKRRQELQPGEGKRNFVEGEITSAEREWYQHEINTLKGTQAELEGQINTLLNTQEQINDHTVTIGKHLDTQRRAAFEGIEREKRAREESELCLRSEIATVQGNYRKERERAQKFMKTMAEMQSADPMKIDNAAISSSVKGLRYAIKNWARAQSLVPSQSPAPGLANYTKSALGLRDRGPNYDFLRTLTPHYQEYTNSAEFKFIIQAYIWKRIVEVVFSDDMWAGVRKSLDDEEFEYRLPLGYRGMKLNLEPSPNEKVPMEYLTQYHEWRSTSARLMDKRLSPQRRKHTVRVIRDDILRPILRSCEPGEQDIQNTDDLDSIVEDAMKLAASMASQRAHFVFELIPPAMYGTMEFAPSMMSETHPPDPFDDRTHYRAVFLLFEPRLLKYGTSEGTAFDTCAQLLEANVETRVVPKRYTKRMGIGR